MIFSKLQMQQPNPQAGVTLLLAVMIVSGISLISITVAFLGIQEIRNSRSAFLTNSAIGAAETGSEQGLWNAKRRNNVDDCRNASYVVSGNTANSVCKSHGSITINLIEKGIQDYEAELYLYDPENPNGDYDLRGCGNCDPPLVGSDGFDVRSLIVEQKSGREDTDIKIYRIKDDSLVKGGSVKKGNTATINGISGPPGQDNRMKVTFTSITPNIIVVNTKGNRGTDVNIDLGIPSMVTLDSTGCVANQDIKTCNDDNVVSRKLEVTLPE